MIFLSSNLAKANKLNSEQKVNFDTFARQVTRHLVDTSFLTYESSMLQLAYSGTKSELSTPVIKMLTQGQDPPVAPSLEYLKGMKRQLLASKSVTCVSLDKVQVDEPNSSGLVPITVEGQVVKHDAGGVFGPAPFRFRFMVGTLKEDGTPVVVAFQDASGQQAQQE